MKPQELIDILAVAERLKCATRHSYTSSGRHESVAEHSWRIALMAMLLREEFPQADMDRVICMCLIHDLGEAFTGDIPAFDKTAEHEQLEAQQLSSWVASLPADARAEFSELLSEMDAMQTQEAQIYKALDKLEAVLQHDEADIATWLPLEYDLQLRYGAENVTFSPYMTALKACIDAFTRRKIEQEGHHG